MNELEYKLKLMEHTEILRGIIDKVKSKSILPKSSPKYITSYFQIPIGVMIIALLIYLVYTGNNNEIQNKDNTEPEKCQSGFCFRTL